MYFVGQTIAFGFIILVLVCWLLLGRYLGQGRAGDLKEWP